MAKRLLRQILRKFCTDSGVGVFTTFHLFDCELNSTGGGDFYSLGGGGSGNRSVVNITSNFPGKVYGKRPRSHIFFHNFTKISNSLAVYGCRNVRSELFRDSRRVVQSSSANAIIKTATVDGTRNRRLRERTSDTIIIIIVCTRKHSRTYISRFSRPSGLNVRTRRRLNNIAFLCTSWAWIARPSQSYN